MIDDKILNAYEYFHASSTFSIFLIADEFNRIDSSYLDKNDKEVYIKLLVTHSSLLMALFKEKVMTKDENKNISLNIFSYAFDKLLRNMYTEDGNKYKLGDMSFDSKKEIFELIRNKLLHGDYVIDLDGYKVILNDKGFTGSIEIADLVESCKTLCTIHDCNLDGVNRRPVTFCKENILKHGPDVINNSSLKKFMNEVYTVTFVDKPVEGYQRDLKYAATMEHFYTFVNQCSDLFGKHSIKNALDIICNKYRAAFLDAHIDFSYEISVATKNENYDKVKQYFFANREFMNKLSNDIRRQYLVQVVASLLYEKETEWSVLASALLNNMKLLANYISDIPISEVNYIKQSSGTYIDDMSIAAVFAQFYACYHYELDEIYSNGVGTSLRDVANGTYLDFSLLDIDDLYDSSMTIDNGFNDFANQLERLEKSLEKIGLRKEGADTAYRNYLAKCKNPRAEAEARLLANIEELVKEYNDTLTLYENAKEFMDTRYDEYVRNYNIISHIRNAFAHGNVRLMHHTSGDTLNDRVIVIEDNYEGENTYKKVITYKEFIKLFDQHNADLLYGFIADKSIKVVNKRLAKVIDE